MAEVAGVVQTAMMEPHIYAVCMNRYIYIGETQSAPVRRWGAHLQDAGTFMSKLRTQGITHIAPNEPLLFIAVRCQELLDIPPVERRLATRYVEHCVQVNAICELPSLWPIDLIISDTLVTAPSYTRHRWIDDVADAVFKMIVARIASAGFLGKAIEHRSTGVSQS